MNTNSLQQELEIIARIRGEATSQKVLVGENLFLAWGYPAAIFLLLEFAALMLWHADWCYWLWAGIPLFGFPLMMYFMNEDYERTHSRTLEQNVVMQLWLFIGFACCVGGFAIGFAGIFPLCGNSLIGLLTGMGCFITGVILHFRPKTICGIIASFLSIVPLFLQGDLWPWQLPVTALIVVIALIIPGHLFRRYVLSRRN